MACAGPNPLAPKFILSGSVFAPTEREFAGRPAHARRSDDWAGYPAERSIVLHEIMAQGAQNVVFVSGDLHCGAVASLHFPDNGLRCYAVVAPPFYAPFLFANTPPAEVAGVEAIESIDRQGRLVSVECRAHSFDAGGFARIAVEPPRGSDPLDWEIGVEYYADGWGGKATLRQAARLARGMAKVG
jgi:alkaline phosphatase D